MLSKDIEYFILRIIRKYLFSENILCKYGNFIPYYRTTSGQFSPTPVVEKYLKFTSMQKLSVADKNILEVGVGVTNCTCYGLAINGANFCYAYEPYVKYNKKLENKLFLKHAEYINVLNKVTRIKDLCKVNPNTIDVIFSNSVLEHVADMDKLCSQLKRIMKNNAWMIHFVDYRDHFFKYQFHFYKYNRKFWEALNPGLSRLRINDHLKIFKKYGFETKIVDKEIAMKEFEKFKNENKIAKEFSNYNDIDLATISSVIFARKR